MNFLNINIKRWLLAAILIALPFLSLNMQKRSNHETWFDQPFSWLAQSTQSFFFSYTEGVREVVFEYLNLLDIKKENAQLKAQNQELQAKLLGLSEIERENVRLTSILEFKQHRKMEMTVAKVVSRDLFSDYSSLVIDKGLDHGLKDGQAVITTEGVLGYVYRPQAKTSQVLLVTDRYAVVDGIVARSRARGLVEGKSRHSLLLRHVEKSEDVVPGDVVVTSGIDNIFPKGFPIAVVESVENKSFSVSLKVDLRPIVDANKVEEVFIITNAAGEDFSDKMTLKE